jgi:hypothetical protein
MAKLVHEIWLEDAGHGPLPSLVLAGPDGDLFRQGLAANARLVKTFEAENNYEAMTIFYAYNGWGEYRLNLPEDRTPYPEAWLERQRSRAPAAHSSEEAPAPAAPQTDPDMGDAVTS